MSDVIYNISSGFFDSVNGDRLYSAADMNKPYKRVIADGIFPTPQGTPSTDFQVVAVSGMSVAVLAGNAMIGSRWAENADDVGITIAGNSSSSPRIDSIFLHIDTGMDTRAAGVVYRQGTAAGTPTAPAMVQTDNITELRLADILVAPSAAIITQANITDQRGGSDCPWVAGLIQQVDTSALFEQYRAAYAEQQQDQADEWNTFMNHLARDYDISMSLRKHESTYTSTAAASLIPINIDGYDTTKDLLQVYINGIFAVEGTHYIVKSAAQIQLTNAISAGQKVHFVIYKAVMGGAQPIIPTDEQVQDAVDAYMDAHPGALVVDPELSDTSTHAIQNKAVTEALAGVNGRLQQYDGIISAVGTGMEPLPTTFAHGNISTSSGTAGNVNVSEAYKYQAVTPNLIHFDRDCTLKVNSGYEYLVFMYTSDGTYSSRTGSWQSGEYTVLAGTYFRIFIRLSPADVTANVPVETFRNNILVNTDIEYRVSAIANGAGLTARKIDASNNGKELLDTAFAHGRILTTTGHVGEVSVSANNYKYQAITPNVVVFDSDRTIKANPGYLVQAWWYDENDTYVSRSANFVSEYTLVAGRRYRFFMRLDPADTTADVDVSIFQDNVYIVSEISERITEIEENPLSSFPDYIANSLAEKPLGPLSKGYILLSCDDGTEGLATYTIPMLVSKNVPATFGLLKDSAVLSNASYLATVVDAVENHGCVVAQHGSATWPTYTESALLSYFEETQAVFTEKGINKTYGAICPGATGYDDTSALVKAVAGGVFGCVFSGNRTSKIAYGSYKSNGPRSNMYDLDRKSAVGFSSAADYQSAIDEAYDNHYLFCPFWHDYSIVNDTAKQAIIEGMIDYAKTKGLTFITMKDLPTII